MLGPIGSTLMSIMRVLTPAEIDRYSELSRRSVKGRMKITAMAAGAEGMLPEDSHASEEFISLHQQKSSVDDENTQESEAEIIPFKSKEELEKDKIIDENPEPGPDQKALEKAQAVAEKIPETIKHSPDPGNELESVGIFSASKVQQMRQEQIRRAKAKQESTTTFIINQRDNLKKSKEKLTEQTAIKLYQKNASQEFIDKEITEDNISADLDTMVSGSKGILINKKQY